MTGVDPVVTTLTVARMRQGLSQAALARKLGCSPNGLCEWETGARTPPLTKVRNWAAALGYNLSLTDVSSTTDNGSGHAQHP